MKKNILFASTIVLLLISFSIVSAQDTKLYINPSSVVDPRLGSGSTFTVDVNIEDVPDLYAFEFKLSYDTKILDCVDVSIKPFLNSPTWVARKNINEGAGVVWVAITSWYPAGPASGSGTLATITFQVVERGESVLDLYKTKLADYDIKLISHDVKDGYFSTIPGKQCKEKWECTEWSECVNGTQTRTCYDLNDCGTEEHKPKEERKCRPFGKVSETIAQILSYPGEVIVRIVETILSAF